MKKIVPVLIAIILIVVIGVVGFGGKIMDKYSYSKELADMDEYYGVSGNRLAIILQDAKVEQQAILENDTVYFDIDTVHQYFNEGFYVDEGEQKLLYTTAVDTVTALFGNAGYSDKTGEHALDYVPCMQSEGTLYVAADYVKLFTNYSYEVFDRHLQVYTEWGTKQTYKIAKKTQVRLKGGIKSPILREMEEGEQVELLEQMETWSKIKTSDSIIGYVENKRLTDVDTEVETPVTDYVPEEYTSIALDGKVCLGFHSIGGPGGNDTLDSMVAEGKGMNVIAPTWFSFTDNAGTFRSFASGQYVEKAHSYGLKVWGVWDNFNYKNETGSDIDTVQILSSTANRQNIVEQMTATALELGLDGINIDFEGLTSDCGTHYVQFIRELSVACRNAGIILSVDNYVPMPYNSFYNWAEQGRVVDYYIIMAYDEHYAGGEAGSVSSISYVENGITDTLKYVPASKTVCALPFYTRVWTESGNETSSSALGIQGAKQWIEDNQVELYWQEELGQYYGSIQKDDAVKEIWMEEETSLGLKMNLISKYQLAGAAFWKLGFEPASVWDVCKISDK